MTSQQLKKFKLLKIKKAQHSPSNKPRSVVCVIFHLISTFDSVKGTLVLQQILGKMLYPLRDVLA